MTTGKGDAENYSHQKYKFNKHYRLGSLGLGTTKYTSLTLRGSVCTNSEKNFFYHLLTTRELMDIDINYERLLQISPKEINMCCIRGEHNPMIELVLSPLSLQN